MRPLFPAKRLLDRALIGGQAAGSKLLDSSLCDGAVVALFLVSMWHQVAATLGGSLATDFSIGWALVIGTILGLAWRGRRGWLLLGLAVWSATLGALLSAIGWGLAQVPSGKIAVADGLPVTLPAATLALAIPVAWSVRLGLLSGRNRLPEFLIGASVGVMLAGHLLFGWIGVDSTVLLAAVISGILFLAELKRGGLTKRIVDGPSRPSPSLDWHSLAGLSILGVVLASLDRMLGQLVPASEWYLLMIAAGLCLGAAAARIRRFHIPVVSLAAMLLLVPATFPWLVDCLLHLKLVGGHPAVLMVAWSILVSVAVMPVGALLATLPLRAGTIPQQDSGASGHGWQPATVAVPVLVLAGLFFGRWLLLPAVGPSVVAVGGSWCVVMVTARKSWLLRPRRAALLLVGLVLLTVQCRGYNPEQAARLLFSGRVVLAGKHQWPRRLHESLDETRFVERCETGDATLTVWSQQGGRRLLRIDGIPVAAWSQDPTISPRFGPEVLGTVLPLVLHDRPQRVLLLGLAGGEGLRAGLGFPVNRVDCVEPDRGLRKLVAGESVFDDARLHWRHLSPALAVSSDSGDYDVVIATAVAPVAWRSESSRTLEFYRNVARQLAPRGVFCQAFSQRDVGAAAVMVSQATIQAVFEASVRVPVGGGRVLVLATNDEELVDRPGLIGRLQAPHVRSALAEIGWDWANLLQLPVRLPSADESLPLNHVGNGWLAARLPTAALGADIVLEKQPHSSVNAPRSLLSLVEVGNEWVAEVRERLADVQKGQQLLGRGAEGLRTYRRAIGQQITTRPRFVFKSDPGQGISRLRHPVDRRRQQFLKILAAVDGVREPSTGQIGRVVAFASPFDPLLSEFVHREAAVLWSRQSGTDRRAELRHRLHAVYFGARFGHGIDDVHEAIGSLLRVDPTAGEAVQQWDHCNALLEVLKQRWSSASAKGFGPGDASDTIGLVGRLFDRMDELVELHSKLGYRWPQRREVVERGLIDPLRLRRSLLPRTRRADRVLAN